MRFFDSNILIYHLNDALPNAVLSNVVSWIAEGAFISVITRIEVLGFPDQSPGEFDLATHLLAYFGEVPLDERVILRAIELRRRRRIRLGDAVVAASALVSSIIEGQGVKHGTYVRGSISAAAHELTADHENPASRGLAHTG